VTKLKIGEAFSMHGGRWDIRKWFGLFVQPLSHTCDIGHGHFRFWYDCLRKETA